ncbi:MAG TPA: TonB-dependent receptor, partial [Pyrinomonadaceae bacterium]|nr:TonB-dependent receptor [Pyrinomonadaceae bacterium]
FPLLENRLFGFVSLDHVENTGANNFNRDVFTLAERDPANWFTRTPANNTPANRAFIASVIDRFGNAVPNDPAAGPRVFRGQQRFDFPARDYSGRFDWNPRSQDNLFARWQYTRQRFVAEDVIPGERADQNHKQQNFGFNWIHLFSARSIGEFRYGLGLRTTLVNIAAGNDTPIIRFFNPSPVTTQSSIGSAGNFPIHRFQTDNQFVYNFTTEFSSHNLKLGTDIRRQQLDDLADNFSRGFYSSTVATCNGIDYGNGFSQFINGCTPNYQKGFGPFFLENRLNEANFYGEDNWRVRSNLTLNLGLRYEYVSAPREIAGRINYGFSADKDNWEPRFGFAWSPDFENGFLRRMFGNTGDSSVRAGYGIYHGRLFQSVFSQGGATVRFNPPNAFFYNQSGLASSSFNPVNLADPTNGFVFSPGPQTARHTLTLIDPGLEMPYTQQWNFTFERQMPFASAFRASYTGNRGIGLLRYALDNLPVHDAVNGVLVANHPNNPANLRGQVIRLASDFQCAGTAGTTAIPFTAQCPNVVPLGQFEYSFRVPRINERRPNGQFGTNVVVSNGAWSYYHAMQLEWTKRLSSNLNLQAAYTWSKAIDTTSEATFVGAGDSNQNGNNTRDSRALSRFHTPHRFTIYGTYRLPFFNNDRGLLGQAFGGWQFSAVGRFSKGTPFTVTTTALDLNFDGFGESRPVLLDPSILGNSVNLPATSREALPRSAFRTLTSADSNTANLVGRNTFFSDGVKTIDVGITKIFSMPWEGHRLTLRADLFNAFNHVQYGIPSAAITNTNFGAITVPAVTYLPRNVQVSLRYQY